MVPDILTNLQALQPVIQEILSISGSPGARVGILHRGKVIYTEGFGYRDVANQLPPDDNTIKYLASLSKTFTAAMVAMLVERDRLEWTTPVSQILPKFQHWDSNVQENAGITLFHVPQKRSGSNK